MGGFRPSVGLVLGLAWPLLAQDVPPGPSPRPSVQDPDRLLSFPRLLLEDAVDLGTSPLRADAGDWTQVLVAAGAVAGTAILLDRPVRRGFQRSLTPGRDRLASNLEKLGGNAGIALAGGMWLYGAAFSPAVKSTAVDAIAAGLIANGVLVPALKELAGRARPSEGMGPNAFRGFSGRESFPSGHTTLAFTLASVISLHAEEAWVTWTSYGLASAVGLARLEQDQHWASDVVAGALLGTAVGRTVTRFNQSGRTGRRASWTFEVEPRLGLGSAGLTARLTF